MFLNEPSIARLSTVSCLGTKSRDTSETETIIIYCYYYYFIMYCAHRKAKDCKNTFDMSSFIFLNRLDDKGLSS